MGIIRSLKTFIKMGCESNSFGGWVLSLEGYSVEGNLWAHTLHTYHCRTITGGCKRSIHRLLLRKPPSPGTGQKALLVLCTLRIRRLPSGHQSRQKRAILTSFWVRWKLEGLKAVEALLLLGTLQFEKSEPPHWTPEDLSQYVLGAYSSVHMERSWLEGWKCGHSHFFLFSSFICESCSLYGMKVSQDKQLYVEPATWQRTGHLTPGTGT